MNALRHLTTVCHDRDLTHELQQAQEREWQSAATASKTAIIMSASLTFTRFNFAITSLKNKVRAQFSHEQLASEPGQATEEDDTASGL